MKKSLIILSIFLSGCASDNYRMQKYDPQTQSKADTATVILGTKNITFMDFTKVTDPKQNIIKTKTAVQPTTPTPTAPTIVTEDKNNNADSSADPTKTNYPTIKLSEIFSSKPRKQVTTSGGSTTVAEQYDIDNQNTYRILKANRVFNYGYANAIYTVEPGIYYISYAYSDENNTERHTQAPGLNADNVVQYGAFEVKAGDTLYLGDLNFDWLQKNPEKMVSIDGDLNTVKQELNASQYQDIASKLKQATFWAGGHKLS